LRFGGRQKTGAQARGGQNSFAHALWRRRRDRSHALHLTDDLCKSQPLGARAFVGRNVAGRVC
jgi:hypothetical protein